MPLLHKKPFVRQKPPVDLRPDEEVFLCKVTHEIFRTYDEFFERTILCNSLVWSCAVTGKPGLTYQEAVESEERAKQSLQNFPKSLLVPLLHLATLTHRTRLHEVCDDIYLYIKERFFPGEFLDMVARSGARHPCQVLEVIAPHTNGAVNGHGKNHMEGDAIVISDSDEEITPVSPSNPKAMANGKKKSSLNPSVFKYKIRLVKGDKGETPLVKAGQLTRKKNVLTRDRMKLLLKQHCEFQDGVIRVKASSMANYKLADQAFCQIFPDEPPVFAFSVPGKGRGRRPADSSPKQGHFIETQDMMRAAEEKLRIMQQREEMAAMLQEKAKVKKKREDLQEAKKQEKENLERQREEVKRMFEEERQKRREEKERLKLEKEREREKLREEKKKYAERLKLWSKPREDMECDDLKELPTPVPVKTRLPPDQFGEALMVLEFLQAFGDLFDIKDEFPDGVSLDVLEEALVGCDPEGPLCELLFFFLAAIFQALAEEEEEVARDQVAEADTKDLSEALDDDADPTQSAITAVAALAAAWPQLHQGCSLKQLDLDSCTLSEILRLHILASGADCNSTNAKFRYQKQGGFTATDDPCVELRLTNPGLLKRLSNTAVYDLLPGEKLKILHALCGKLLTLVSTRDFIENSADEQRQAKQELRELKAEQHRREREEAAERMRRRKEEKLKEQELKLREKMKEEGKNGAQTTGVELDTSVEPQEVLMNTEDEEETTPSGKTKKGKGSSPKDKEKDKEKEPLSAEELQQQQQKERELLERIQKAAACTYILPLGRDRFYRRYWLFPAAGALFVEDDFFGITEDMLLPQTPAPEPEYKVQPETQANESQEEVKMETDETKQEGEVPEGGAGVTHIQKEDTEETVLHNCGPPVNRPNQWAFYGSIQEVEELMEALNSRGHRESNLKEALQSEKERITQLLDGTMAQRYSHTDKSDGKAILTKGKSNPAPTESPASAERHMVARLRDLLLDIEDRIYQGTLGAVKTMERSEWRGALEGGNYEVLAPELRENGCDKSENGDGEPMELDEPHIRAASKDRLQELKAETLSTASTSASTPQPVNNIVHYFAHALAQIEQGIERKFLKAPLGDDDSKKDQKDKKKKDKRKDEDQTSEKDDGSDCGRQVKRVQERWRESLLACSSLSQVFLHLSTLERSVVWAKSLLNTRCKLCRRKGDAENMLLCDGCDRGHHIYCIRPKLKAVPAEDWFCPECRPKQRSHRINSRQRSSVDSEEEVEEEEESEEDEEEEEEESEEDSDEEEEEEEEAVETPPRRAAVKLSVSAKSNRSASKPTPKQSNSAQSTPRNQQSSTKQSASAGKGGSKGSGKKATPVSNGKAPPRAGSRSSSRLSQEILATNGPASKTSSPAVESRKRSSTELPPKSKMVLTPVPTSSSSSSRRSSGRNLGVHELSACEQLTVELVRHEDSWPFKKLVSKTQVPDYYNIIKKPIALSVIREKVNNCEYKTAAEYIDDVELMFTNCLEYNPRNTNEAKAGSRLQAFFHAELQKLGLSDRLPTPPKQPRL